MYFIIYSKIKYKINFSFGNYFCFRSAPKFELQKMRKGKEVTEKPKKKGTGSETEKGKK